MLPDMLTPEARREFLEERQSILGSSDAPVVAGLDEYGKDVVDLYYDKARPIPDEEVDRRSIHLQRGVLLEDVGADLYRQLTGRKVRKMGLSRHELHEWAGTHTDRQILAAGGTDVESTGALEVKAPGIHVFGKILDSGLTNAQIAQGQWHLACTGYDWGDWAIINLEHSAGPLVVLRFERNELVIEQLLERGHRFWHEHVEPRKVPDIRDWMDLPDLEIPPHDTERHVVPADDAEVFAPLFDAWWERKIAEERYEQVKDQVQGLMDAKGVTKLQVQGLGKINYGHREGQVRVALKKVEAARPLDWDKVREHITGLRAELGARQDQLDDEELNEVLESLQLDFDQFRYQGTPYRHFQPYPDKETDPRKESA